MKTRMKLLSSLLLVAVTLFANSQGCIGDSFFSAAGIFSCPEQLNRWPCPLLAWSVTTNHQHYRVNLETCDLWDIWSEWWGDMNFKIFWEFSDFLRIFRNSENFQKFWEFSEILRIFRKSENFPKIWEFSKHLHTRLGWRDHQCQRVIDRPDLGSQLLET